MSGADSESHAFEKGLLSHLWSSYSIPLTLGIVGGLTYQAYKWYFSRAKKCNNVVPVTCLSDELPLQRPLKMGNEDVFRKIVYSSNLPDQLKTVLCRDGVYIRDPTRVITLLRKMLADGIDLFQVVTDFDATLTRYHRDGKRCDSSYGILDTSPLLPTFYRDECDKLRAKYHAIEVDPNLTVEEKTPHMKNWWTKAHNLLQQTNLNKAWLGQMVQQSSAELRDRTGSLFAILDHCHIPLLIYSAGIGDLILEVLSQRCTFKRFSDPPLIVANFIKFDQQGTICGFSDELIHTFNKHEIFPHHRDYFTKHNNRTNVLLMGDMVGDLRMADGMSAKENVITIGFLNTKVQDSFGMYRDSFDIVLIDDQTMDVPIAIVEAITTSPSS